MLEYFQMIDHDILTEEFLTEEQIINMIQSEKNQDIEEDDDEDEDEAIELVSEKKAIDALEILINYFEQQTNSEFNTDDLRIFRKYLRVIRVKEIDSKKQSTLDLFLNDCGM